MRPPPRWLRRLLIDPAFVAGVVLAGLTLPVVVVVAAFISRYVPGRWRILRIIWFLFLYVAVDALAVVIMFGFWVGSGFGWRLQTAYWQDAHQWLFSWMLRRLVASAKFTFKVALIREGPSPRTMGSVGGRSVLVLSRHAGPGDSMLLMDGLANQFKRRPRIVLKEFLQWDPAIDVMLNRLPSAFVPQAQKGDELLTTISTMAKTMDEDDAFVIFPEGGNYTRKRPPAIDRETQGDWSSRPRRTGREPAKHPASEVNRRQDGFGSGTARLRRLLRWSCGSGDLRVLR